MTAVIPECRGRDKHGAGYFNASRGSRKHHGQDFCAAMGEPVCAFNSGTVTKLGYAYNDDLSFRYIELDLGRNTFVRYFYVNPTVKLGDKVEHGDAIGTSQDIAKRYDGITPHYHYEVFKRQPGSKERDYIDPIRFLSGDA